MASNLYTEAFITALLQNTLLSNSVQVCLATGSLTYTNTKASFIAAELPPTLGYDRVALSYGPSDFQAFNTGTWSLSTVQKNAVFTPAGGTLTWQTMFAILDGRNDAALEFADTDVNPSTNAITVTGHGLSSAEEFMIGKVNLTDTLPGGVSASTIYYAEVIDANTIRPHTNSTLTSALDITSAGVGSFWMKYATGTIISSIPEASPINQLDGQPYTYPVTISQKSQIV